MRLAQFFVALVVVLAPTRDLQSAQDPPCRMSVVHCNYAHLYSGKVTVQTIVRGPEGRDEMNMDVGVTGGVATCVGTVSAHYTRTGSRVGTINGRGLIAVEFEPDSADNLAYRVTVSCPSPAYSDSPSQPAELGSSYTQESYHQRATKIAQTELKKQISYPAPESDAVNGVSGTVTMSWDLKR